jgi:hypothetical protein
MRFEGGNTGRRFKNLMAKANLPFSPRPNSEGRSITENFPRSSKKRWSIAG